MLESMLVQQQLVVDNMIQYLESLETRMRELEKREGIFNARPGTTRRTATGSCRRVVTEMGDDLEESGRRSGDHGGSHGAGHGAGQWRAATG